LGGSPDLTSQEDRPLPCVPARLCLRNSSLYYAPLEPCPNGHLAPRLKSTRRCLECKSVNMRKWRMKEPWAFLVDLSKTRAKRKHLSFDLDKEWASEKFTGKCELTGIDFVIGKGRSGFSPLSPTIDRINSRHGYLKGVVSSLWRSTSSRGKWTTSKCTALRNV
jgi:hypothetical protein